MQVKPDVITVWPIAYDYPLYRAQIERNLPKLDKVIFGLTYNDLERDFRDFMEVACPYATLTNKNNKQPGQFPRGDWYHVALSEALKKSKSDWVLFLEQDFVFDDQFLKWALQKAEEVDFVGYESGTRLHLCFLLVKRSLINKTVRYFGATPGLDCFDLFTTELQILAKHGAVVNGNNKSGFHKHLNGLTHNYRLFIDQKHDLIYHPPEFFAYNKASLESDVLQQPLWLGIMEQVNNFYAEP